MNDDKRERRLSEDEDALWRGVARSIKPLRAKPLRAKPAAPAPLQSASSKPPQKKPAARAPTQSPPPKKPAPITLDRRTRQKLARGHETIDAKLDLHGMTQAQAHAALSRFLHRVQADGGKFVIVVTGKGARGSTGEHGVLRRQVPLWLALPEFRALVVGFEAAHVGHGGDGALYVRVRRGR